MDNYLAGRSCGKLVKEALPNGGSVALFIGRLEQDNARRRRQGVIDELLDRSSDSTRYDSPGATLENSRYQIVSTMTDQFDRAKGKANVEDTLSRFPELNAMVGLFAYNTPLILEALSQQSKLGKVKVVSFDEADETLAGIQNGTVYGTVVQSPYQYGYQSVALMAQLAKGVKVKLPNDQFIDIPANQIRYSNLASFWDDLKQKIGKK